jgi:peptidoglycan-associated lipoprotein
MTFKNILIAACFICLSGAAIAQPMRASRPEYSLKVAEESEAANDYYNALEYYEKYYEQGKDRAIAYKIANLHMLLRDYAKAETWFARVLLRDKKATGEENPEARYHLGMMQKMTGKYEESILTFEDFLKESTDETKTTLAKVEVEGAKMAMKMKENTVFIVENAGAKVNSPNNEYSPTVSSDGSTLYYTSYRFDKIITLDGKEGDYHAKIMTATKNARGAWADPAPVDGDINRPGVDQGSVYVSPKGDAMYFTRIELSGNVVTKSTLFYSKRNGETWSPSQEVTSLNGNYIIKHPALGELYGKEVLFFVSNMEGSKGYDIYYADKTGEGSFGAPKSIGSPINTIGDEESPFYRDGKLYFSSNGHPSIGGLDVFSSNWNGSSWSKPENMGKGINSETDDHYFNMDEDGSIFLLSNRPGGRSLKSRTCCEDIYSVKKEPIKINLIVTATAVNKKPLGGLGYRFVEIIGGKSGKPDEQTADSYRSDLLPKKAYMIITSKPGYYSDTTEFNTVDIKTTTTIEKKVVLKPLPTISASLVAKTIANEKPINGVTYSLVDVATKKADTKTLDVYSSALTLNKQYMIIASKAGWSSDTAKFNTNDIKETTEIEKVLTLKPKTIIVKRNERIKLNDLYYKLDKSAANAEEMENWNLAQQSLDYLYNIMVKYPDVVIELSSHTDSQGSDKYNLELSTKRARGVENYLNAKGIDKTRVVAKGLGETKLVNECKNGVKCTPEQHLQNRRTEFRILSGPTTIEITEQQSAVNN